MNEMETNEESVSVINTTISPSLTSEFITVNLQESEEGEKLTNDTDDRESFKKDSKRLKRVISSTKVALDEEALIENQASATLSQNTLPELAKPSQELPNPCDMSPPAQVEDSPNNNQNDIRRVEVSHRTISQQTSSTFSPVSKSASIFAFIVTVAFVCILWLVVFMIFGYRGHAIAGVFIGIFLVGLLLNTCFLKLYLRLKVFLGLNGAIRRAERQAAAIQRRRQIQEQIVMQKASERPPSYDKAVASPPPYNLLQYYRQKKSTTSLISSASRASIYRKGHRCPFCKREVKIFGICVSCKNNLSKK